MPHVVLLKPQGAKDKIVEVDARACGLLQKVWHKPSGLDTQGSYVWVGDFTVDGLKIDVGPTEKVADLISKCERLIRSAMVRKVAA